MVYVFWVGVVLSIVGTIGCQDVEDYCTAEYCQPEERNVGCHPPSSDGGPVCTGKSASSMKLATFGKRIILNQHNTLRSQLASGELAAFASAARMPTLLWDEELARQAGHNARSCVYAHDACRNTKPFRYVGQNIALVRFSGQSIPIAQLIEERIRGWWSEYNVTTQAQLERFPKEQSGPPIGHFTQMISDRTWKIGCAVQTWKEKSGEYRFYLVCNYSCANLEDQPVYRRGPMASRCRTGENPDYPGLCSVDERIFSTPSAVKD